MEGRGFQRAARACLLAGLLGLAVCSLAAAVTPKQPGSWLEQKVFFKPELYISSSQFPVEEVLEGLPNRAAWQGYLAAAHEKAAAGSGTVPRAFIDPRSGAATNLMGAFPLVPGRGVGNRLRLADLAKTLGRPVTKVNSQTILDAVLAFVNANQGVLGIDLTQMGAGRADAVTEDLWQ